MPSRLIVVTPTMVQRFALSQAAYLETEDELVADTTHLRAISCSFISTS